MNTDNDISDILKALERSKANVPKDWDYLIQDDDVMMQLMELDYNSKPIGVHLGISVDQFPSLEQLEDDEVQMIVDKTLDTWVAYNYYADLPEGIPIRLAYKLILSVWNDEVSCCPEGNLHLIFCHPELEPYMEDLL